MFSSKIKKLSTKARRIFIYIEEINNKEFSLICHLCANLKTELSYIYSQSFHDAVPILENAENAQARQHVQQQFLLRFSRERLQQYTVVRRCV